MARRIEVELVGDSRSLERAFKRSERSAKNFNGTMAKTKRGLGRGGGLAGLGGGVGAGAAISQSVKAASDFEQQMAKVGTVFGDVRRRRRGLVGNHHQSVRALRTASPRHRRLVRCPVQTHRARRPRSRETSEGAHRARRRPRSFYNTDVQSALDAVRSGLVGEAEPLAATASCCPRHGCSRSRWPPAAKRTPGR